MSVSPKESGTNPAKTTEGLPRASQFIREIKQGLVGRKEFSEAAMASWLNLDPTLHIVLNGVQTHITYSDRWSNEVPDGYVWDSEEDGHRTYKRARVEEVMYIERGNESLFLKNVLEKGTGYEDAISTTDEGASVRIQENNPQAAARARKMIDKMFGNPPTNPQA